MKMKKLSCLLFVSGLWAIGSLPTHASLILHLDAGGGNNVTVADNGVGDLDGAIGSVRWAGTLGTWLSNFNFTIGQSNSPGTTGLASLDLFSIHATSRRGGNLRIELIENGFLAPIGPNLVASSSVDGFTNGRVAFESRLNSTTIGTLGAFGAGNFSGTAGTTVNTIGGFSLTQIANIYHSTGGITEFRSNTSITNVPEPATLGLFGLGLIALGILRRRRDR